MTWPHGGLGTEESPYLVPDADALDDVRDFEDDEVYFKQTANISLADYQAGAGWPTIEQFRGFYDANGYSISGLRINTTGNKALININTGSIDKVVLHDAQVTTSGLAAALVVENRIGGSITEARVGTLATPVQVTGTSEAVACITAINADTITDCFYAGTVTRNGTGMCQATGGVGVQQRSGTSSADVSSVVCRVAGVATVTSAATNAYSSIGGMFMSSVNSPAFEDCAAYGELTAVNILYGAGGFTGRTDKSTIKNTRCLADCSISYTGTKSGSREGGFTGWTLDAVDCYYNEDTFATDIDPDTIGLTAEEMKDSSNFTNFDFDDVWFMLTAAEINALHPGYGDAAYAALPENIKDKPWLQSLSDVIIEGITPGSASYYQPYKGSNVIRKIYKNGTEYRAIVGA